LDNDLLGIKRRLSEASDNRRLFHESLKEDKVRGEYALEQIGLLYDVERRADQEHLSYEERAELRSRLSYPIMVAFEKWMLKEYPKVLPKGRIGKAISYTYRIYHKLTRYHLDGRLKMDNNLGYPNFSIIPTSYLTVV